MSYIILLEDNMVLPQEHPSELKELEKNLGSQNFGQI